jgi:nucleotide-binding universal stress UspA family protein
MASSLKGGMDQGRLWSLPDGTLVRFAAGPSGQDARMKRIVVGAKAGADQPWLADAAAELAEQMGAEVAVVSMDGLELEALSTLPRSELARDAAAAAQGLAERIATHGVRATGEHRPGPVVRGILIFAEEQEADVIVVGATTRGPVARRMLGNVTARLIERSRRPVLVITPPAA